MDPFLNGTDHLPETNIKSSNFSLDPCLICVLISDFHLGLISTANFKTKFLFHCETSACIFCCGFYKFFAGLNPCSLNPSQSTDLCLLQLYDGSKHRSHDHSRKSFLQQSNDLTKHQRFSHLSNEISLNLISTTFSHVISNIANYGFQNIESWKIQIISPNIFQLFQLIVNFYLKRPLVPFTKISLFPLFKPLFTGIPFDQTEGALDPKTKLKKVDPDLQIEICFRSKFNFIIPLFNHISTFLKKFVQANSELFSAHPLVENVVTKFISLPTHSVSYGSFYNLFKNLGGCTPLASPATLLVSVENDNTMSRYQLMELTITSLIPKILSFMRDQDHSLILDPLSHIEVRRKPLFILGRYKKYSRNCSQTPWNLNPHSVQSALANNSVLQYLGATGSCLIGSGREDADVLMLGTGRPFILRFSNPKNVSPLLDILQSSMNVYSDLATAHSLSIGSVSDQLVFHKSSASKIKRYRAYIWIENPFVSLETINSWIPITDHNLISDETAKTITQKTPLRVLHRRSLVEREKTIYYLQLYPVPDKSSFFLLDIITGAGTYIKEFVNGDIERTKPSFRQLCNCRTSILALDVLDIGLDAKNLNIKPVEE